MQIQDESLKLLLEVMSAILLTIWSCLKAVKQVASPRQVWPGSQTKCSGDCHSSKLLWFILVDCHFEKVKPVARDCVASLAMTYQSVQCYSVSKQHHVMAHCPNDLNQRPMSRWAADWSLKVFLNTEKNHAQVLTTLPERPSDGISSKWHLASSMRRWAAT